MSILDSLQAPGAFDLTLLDLIGLSVFLASWIGYTIYADRVAADKPNLNTVMYRHRLAWMRSMLRRETRIFDSQILAITMQNVSLFASISVLIIGGLFAVLGSAGSAQEAFLKLPFVAQTGQGLWETKVLALALVFVYAFFKFAWSLRQFNYTGTVMAAAPEPDRDGDPDPYARRLASLGSLAVESYNRGIRSYFYGFALLGWFLHPVLLIVSALWVTAVIQRREFRSRTLAVLCDDS